jgi:hypothetical protein
MRLSRRRLIVMPHSRTERPRLEPVSTNLELLDRRCAERAQDLREVFAGTPEDDVAATSIYLKASQR